LPKKKASTPEKETVELLTNMLIVQLGLAKVAQGNIRRILGCNMGRVSNILKHLPKAGH